MRRTAVPGILLVFLFSSLLLAPQPPARAAEPVSTCAPDGVQSTGAIYRICMPPASRWNGDLVIFAHGYVAFNEPFGIPEDQVCSPDGLCLPTLINALGFAFATTSYSVNGLAVLEGIQDVVDLVDVFAGIHGAPGHVYLTGASEGGIVTALAIEQHPDVFTGGLAACGPIGDFHRQISYFGDFRVIFEYFFPGLLPPSVTAVPDSVIENWDTIWENEIKPVVLDPVNKPLLDQLLKVAKAPFVKDDPATIELTVHDALWYWVFATNDAHDKLGGQPFDNIGKRYRGSKNDTALNAAVVRVAADQAAVDAIGAGYQTTGQIEVPLVTLHTLLDQQVPYAHEPLYRMKVKDAGLTALHTNIPVFRYGHCNFKPLDVLLAFGILVNKATGQEMAVTQSLAGQGIVLGKR
jgi:hypothetical protein